MFGDVVAAGTKALGGTRFSLVSVLPGTLVATVVFVAAQSGAYGPGAADIGRLIGSDSPLKNTGLVLLLVFLLFLAGVLLQPFQVALVQYLEGYWDRYPTRILSPLAIELHRRRLLSARAEEVLRAPDAADNTLRSGAASSRAAAVVVRRQRRARILVNRYPQDVSRVMPTMLGNVLRNGEDAAGKRYGLGALTVYPRMYPSISKPLADAIARQLDVITLTASLCVAMIIGAAVTLPLVFRLDRWTMVPAIAVLLTVVSYRGAVRAAADHAVLFATAFDLHRFDMIRALHYEPPATADQEWELNSRLTRFLSGREPVDPSDARVLRLDHSIYGREPVPDTPEESAKTGENHGTSPPDGLDGSPPPRPDRGR